MARLWQQQLVSCCSLDFTVSCRGVSGSSKRDLKACWSCQPTQGPAGLGQSRLSCASSRGLVQLGAAVHAGAFSRGLALQGMWGRRNVLPVQPETLGLIQPEKQGGLWQLGSAMTPWLRGWGLWEMISGVRTQTGAVASHAAWLGCKQHPPRVKNLR